jgi:hypothetical protein
VVAVVAGVGLAYALWPSSPPAKVGVPPARTRTYSTFEACLLTGSRGLNEPGAGDVWAGMQDVSDATSIRVSFLSASGPQTAAGVLPYANALVQRECRVILAVGAAEVDAAMATALKAGGVSYVLVGSGKAAAHVTVIAAGDGVRQAVSRAVRASLPSGSPQ